MNKTVTLLAALACTASAVALADEPQLYKWTDAQGVIHYSDKAPADSSANVQTMNLPTLAPQDTTKIAAQQAALTAQVAATQRLVQQQALAQQQEATLAAQQAALDAQVAQMQEAQQFQQTEEAQEELTQPPPAVFFHSVYVPSRATLFTAPPTSPQGPAMNPPVVQPPVNLLGKPKRP